MRQIRSSIYFACYFMLFLEYSVINVSAAERQQVVRRIRPNHGYNHPPEEFYQPIPVAIVYEGSEVRNEKSLKESVSTKNSLKSSSDVTWSDDDIFVKVSRNNKHIQPASYDNDKLKISESNADNAPRPKFFPSNILENRNTTSTPVKILGHYDLVIGKNYVELSSSSTKENLHSTKLISNEKATSLTEILTPQTTSSFATSDVNTSTAPQLKLTTHFKAETVTENNERRYNKTDFESTTSGNYPSTSKSVSSHEDAKVLSKERSNINNKHPIKENLQIPVAVVYEDSDYSNNNRGSLILNRNNRRRGTQKNQTKPVDSTPSTTPISFKNKDDQTLKMQPNDSGTIKNKDETRSRRRPQRVRSRLVDRTPPPSTTPKSIENTDDQNLKRKPGINATRKLHSEVQSSKNQNDTSNRNIDEVTNAGIINGSPTTYKLAENKNLTPFSTKTQVQPNENQTEVQVQNIHFIANKNSLNDTQKVTSKPNPDSTRPNKFQSRKAVTIADDLENNTNDGTPSRQRKPVIPIVDSENRVYGNTGQFHYSYEGGDGTKAFGTGELKNVDDENAGEAVVGGFSYTDKEGNDFSLSYTADERGYRPTGDHLPTPPPIPPAIARALAYLATKPTPETVTEKPEKPQ